MRTPLLMDSLQKVRPVFKGIPVFALTLGLAVIVATTGCDEDQAVFQPAVSKLLEKAQALKQAEQPEEALCRLKAAEDIMPNAYQVQYNLGTLLSEQNQPLAAIAHLEKALALKPDDPNTLYTLAYSQHTLGDLYAQALAAKPGDEVDPAAKALTANLSKEEITAKSKDAYQKAITGYETFLKKAPDGDPGRKDVEGQLNYLQSQPQ